MTIGSWTYDMEGIDYYPENGTDQRPFGTRHCIENEGWRILGTDGKIWGDKKQKRAFETFFDE